MWSSLLNQTLDYIKSTTVDGYGTVTETTLYTDVKCRWQEKFEIALNKAGEQELSKIQCWILPSHNGNTVTIDTDYIFVYNSVSYRVVSFVKQYGLSGIHEFTKIYLK